MPFIPTFTALQELDPIPFCSIENTVDQAISRITPTLQAFNFTEDDVTGMHDVGDNTRVNIKRTGVYTIHTEVRWEQNATGLRTLRLLLNGAIWEEDTEEPRASSPTIQQMTAVGRFSAGAYIQVQIEHTAAAATIDSVAAAHVPHLYVVWNGL